LSSFIRDDNEHPDDAVMKCSLQDHVIADTYENLPWLKYVHIVALHCISSTHSRSGIFCPWAVNYSLDAPSPIWFAIWQDILEPYNEA
jgi:hypothetical protein